MGGEEQHRGGRRAVADLAGGLEPVHAAHADVHDHDVRAAALGERDRGLAVGCLADDANVRRARERQAQPFADDLVVVGDQAGDGGLFFAHSTSVLTALTQLVSAAPPVRVSPIGSSPRTGYPDWQPGHHQVVRPSSPCACLALRVPHRGQAGRP